MRTFGRLLILLAVVVPAANAMASAWSTPTATVVRPDRYTAASPTDVDPSFEMPGEPWVASPRPTESGAVPATTVARAQAPAVNTLPVAATASLAAGAARAEATVTPTTDPARVLLPEGAPVSSGAEVPVYVDGSHESTAACAVGTPGAAAMVFPVTAIPDGGYQCRVSFSAAAAGGTSQVQVVTVSRPGRLNRLLGSLGWADATDRLTPISAPVSVVLH